MTAGLIVWVASCLLCGLSPSYYSLAVGRVLSGVGEASFQSVVPPFIDSNAPHESRGKWLAVFYLASPLGTALGYAWGGVLGSSVLTWRAAFLLEAFPVVVFLPLLWVTPYHRLVVLLWFSLLCVISLHPSAGTTREASQMETPRVSHLQRASTVR